MKGWSPHRSESCIVVREGGMPSRASCVKALRKRGTATALYTRSVPQRVVRETSPLCGSLPANSLLRPAVSFALLRGSTAREARRQADAGSTRDCPPALTACFAGRPDRYSRTATARSRADADRPPLFPHFLLSLRPSLPSIFATLALQLLSLDDSVNHPSHPTDYSAASASL